MAKDYEYDNLDDLFEHFKNFGVTAEEIQHALESKDVIRPEEKASEECKMDLPSIKGFIKDTIGKLRKVDKSLDRFAQVDEVPDDVQENKEKYLEERIIPFLREIVALRSTHMNYEIKRDVQHRYASPGDPRPTLVQVGPTRVILQITYDSGEHKITQAKKND